MHHSRCLNLAAHLFLTQAAKAVLSQLKRLARALWSNPPTHGARIAAEVVGDAGMFEEWKAEVRLRAENKGQRSARGVRH